MSSLFFTDLVDVIPTSEDEWGRITEGAGVKTKARVEDFNNLIKDQNGNEVMPNMLVFLPKGTDFKKTYFIKVKTKQGDKYEEADKKWSVKNSYNAGMFKKHHIEVYL
jgi:hypothetical protein